MQPFLPSFEELAGEVVRLKTSSDGLPLKVNRASTPENRSVIDLETTDTPLVLGKQQRRR